MVMAFVVAAIAMLVALIPAGIGTADRSTAEPETGIAMTV
jgi:hypothetical protein